MPLSGTQQIIAPYWADADTGGTGQILYRQSTDPSLLARATKEIQEAFPLSKILMITNLLIATWVDVGYSYQNIDKVNSALVSYLCIQINTHMHMYIMYLHMHEITNRQSICMIVHTMYDLYVYSVK